MAKREPYTDAVTSSSGSFASSFRFSMPLTGAALAALSLGTDVRWTMLAECRIIWDYDEGIVVIMVGRNDERKTGGEKEKGSRMVWEQ